MFKPVYKLTPKLVGLVGQVERSYGQLEALRVPYKIELDLRRKNLTQSAYVSNSIEGNPLSLPEVTNLLLGDRVPVNRDEKEVENYFNILSGLEKKQNDCLSVGLMLSFHKQLLKGVQDKIAGKIRDKSVVVGKYVPDNETGELDIRIKHEPPSHDPEKIKKLIHKLFVWANTKTEFPAVLKAGIFHHQFVYIHPFEDGNGRVCRLMTVLVFMRSHYLINKYFILDDYYDIDRIMYSDKLHSADNGDKTEWLEYFTEGVMYSLEAALDKVRRAARSLDIKTRPTPREEEVLKLFGLNQELTSSQVVHELRVSRQQAHNLLKGLVEKGLLTKMGSTKSSYYALR